METLINKMCRPFCFASDQNNNTGLFISLG